MSPFINNCTSGMPFWRVADRDRSSHCTSTLRQQHPPFVGNRELHWTVEPHQEISAPAGCASNASSWSDNAFLDPYFSMYDGGAWLGDQGFEGVRHGLLFAAPNGNGNESGMALAGMEAAAPVLQQAPPVVQRALPDFQFRAPPFLDRTQFLGPWPTSSWHCPVDTASHHSEHVGSTGSLGMGPEIFPPPPPSMITGHTECGRVPTGRLPSAITLNSVQRSAHSDPVPIASSAPRPCGKRWDLSLNATTFRCLWTSGETRCTALIMGDRRSLTSHLRNEHDFTCDGQTIPCAWGECTLSMQRRNIPRHIVTCHFEIKVKCSQCGLALSRADANKKHRLTCMGVRTPAAVEPAEEDDGQMGF